MGLEVLTMDLGVQNLQYLFMVIINIFDGHVSRDENRTHAMSESIKTMTFFDIIVNLTVAIPKRPYICSLVVWNMLFFSIHLGMSSSQLTNSIIFLRGRYTTNQSCFILSIPVKMGDARDPFGKYRA